MVNSEILNARIFKHTILELSYEMDSKNMRYTFETFFSQIQLMDTVLDISNSIIVEKQHQLFWQKIAFIVWVR